jgi:hypothetical protein
LSERTDLLCDLKELKGARKPDEKDSEEEEEDEDNR